MKHEQTTEKVQQGTGKTRVLAGRRWVIVRGTILLAIAVAIFQGMKKHSTADRKLSYRDSKNAKRNWNEALHSRSIYGSN